MIIREAEEKDIPRLQRLATKTYVDAFGYSFTPEELQRRIKETRSEAYFTNAIMRDVIFVAEEYGQLIGYAECGPVGLPVKTQEGDRELSRLFVLKEHQGKGVGTSLLNTLLAHPSMQNAPCIWLDVWEKNDGAIRLYKSYGFEDTGKVIDGDIIMVRRKQTS